MERHEIMELLGQLKLAGMRAAYDEVVAAGMRAQHPFQRIFGELLLAQLADHRARSVGGLATTKAAAGLRDNLLEPAHHRVTNALASVASRR